jgi:uncharacterized protein (TIGR02996 family)
MTDEYALLAGILDDPDDTASRLIFADWLEEHGQTERAAFIRLQCDLADAAAPRRTEKRQRVRGLLARYGFTWLGPLRRLVPAPGGGFLRWDFARGFVEKLTFPASIAPQQLVAVLRDAFRFAPLRRLRAHPRYASIASEWADPGAGLMHNEGAAALASCPGLTALRSLELPDSHIGPEGFQALIDSPYLRGLTWLDLRRTGNCGYAMSEQTEQALRQRFGDAVQVGSIGEEHLNLGNSYSRTLYLEDHTTFRHLWGDSAEVGPAEPLPGRKRGPQ